MSSKVFMIANQLEKTEILWAMKKGEAQRVLTDQCDPLRCALAYEFGKLTDKQKKEFEKESPRFYGRAIKSIEEGIKLGLSKRCYKCYELNEENAEFCKKCGFKPKREWTNETFS